MSFKTVYSKKNYYVPPPLLHSARFWRCIGQFVDIPADCGTEIVFVGRSNCGKSTLINILCGNKQLAYTSKRPGRTQTINMYAVNHYDARLVDLPGYGYAKTTGKTQQRWGRIIDSYLSRRTALKQVFVLMDARHPLQPYDRQFLAYVSAIGLAVDVIWTKCDKLNQRMFADIDRIMRTDLNGVVEWRVSALDNRGLAPLAARIVNILTT